MQAIIDILLWPFLACLLLTGIHCYLGIHVIARGVIFVDLALAQIAALGAACAVLLGYEPQSGEAYVASLGLALAGAALFALARVRDETIPQEAIIGITYGVASAVAVLILSRTPHGQEEIQSMLVGSILYVLPEKLWRTLLIYGGVGVFHLIYRRQFLLISTDLESARQQGLSLRWWDFLFYTSFAVVITSSVQMAGILMVFSYLVIPAVAAMLLFRSIMARLVFGWAFGSLASVAGLWLSYEWDFPTGAAVVTTFGALLVLVLASFGLVRRLRARGREVAVPEQAKAVTMPR